MFKTHYYVLKHPNPHVGLQRQLVEHKWEDVLGKICHNLELPYNKLIKKIILWSRNSRGMERKYFLMKGNISGYENFFSGQITKTIFLDSRCISKKNTCPSTWLEFGAMTGES